MARRSTWILVFFSVIVVLIAALSIGISIYNSSPKSYEHILARYLKALASGDTETSQSLVSKEFVNELSDLRLSPGAFRAYDFGFQGAASSESATRRFAVVVLEGEQEAAYLADAVFRKKGLHTVLTAVRKIGTGSPIVD